MANNGVKKTSNEVQKTLADIYAFEQELKKLTSKPNIGLNVFYATGMVLQEIRHSCFLAGIISPQNQYGWGTAILEQLLIDIFDYSTDGRDNKKIICGTNKWCFKDKNDFLDILSAKDLFIDREQTLNDEIKGRTDIVIVSNTAKKIIVIENKVKAKTEDFQLQRYEDKLNQDNSSYKDFKKAFVFLTPQGDKPYDFNEPRDNWSIYSYKRIVEIISSFIKDKNNKINNKAKILIGDYIDMVNIDILNENGDIRKACKRLKKSYSNIIDLIAAYSNNSEDVFAYCYEYFNNSNKYKDKDLELKRKKQGNSFFIYTNKIFNKIQSDWGCKDIAEWWCKIEQDGSDNIIGTILIQQTQGERLSELQKNFIKMKPERNKKNYCLDDEATGERDYTYCERIQISPEEDRGKELDTDLKGKIDERLDDFYSKLLAFEKELLSL